MPACKKILLVDDDKDDQLFFIDALQELYPETDCVVANNGVEAMDHLHQTPPVPSIIFLDLNMPYMNGFECLAAIRQDSCYQQIPIVILTTSNNPSDQKRSLEMGADLFLTKPSDFSGLKIKIRQILESIITRSALPAMEE